MDAKTRKYIEWFNGDDTGISSCTLLCIHLRVKHRYGLDAPYDVADFGRCFRVVEKFPEIRDSFPKVARRVKAFRGILKHWDQLCDLYRTGVRRKAERMPELYARIKELRGDRV